MCPCGRCRYWIRQPSSILWVSWPARSSRWNISNGNNKGLPLDVQSRIAPTSELGTNQCRLRRISDHLTASQYFFLVNYHKEKEGRVGKWSCQGYFGTLAKVRTHICRSTVPTKRRVQNSVHLSSSNSRWNFFS